MDNYKTIIEIGSFSIKTIIYSELNKDFSIIGTGKTRSRGYTGEEIDNFDDFIESIKNSIVQAEKQANYIIKDAYILITNQSVQIKKTQKDLMLDGAIVEKNDLRKISNFQIDQNKFKNTIETTSFDKMKNLEKEKGFFEAKTNLKTGKKIPFFNLGPKNDWKKMLDVKIRKKIEEAFKKEMVELGYL